ncbi:hypothetical protein VDG03_19380 [Xanthomonas campestris pv. raphani]|uniref:hypothetical protein n=1 Tax=Xanthomonas campestris TaxID=339 RepID=UPI0017EC75D8|nr:hypothetical protein [Xanthomonas campestris]MBB4129651.1 hypothetical protein [Xanthomonas sp. 3075]MEA9753136.1 hypothetical protein [Xanthomonas campestris pv. raphani]MEA9813345.1 hypothetical protein [Xanthomonas campestris pv. raphani]
MTIEEFWNQAYLAALSRVPPQQAKANADEATEICIAHWQEYAHRISDPRFSLWQAQPISGVPKTISTIPLSVFSQKDPVVKTSVKQKPKRQAVTSR